MRRRKTFLFRVLSLGLTVSFLHLLCSVATVPDAMARMAPPWSTPHVPRADACIPPAVQEAAWREAMRLAHNLAETDPMGDEIAGQLRRAHAGGTLPFASAPACPELVVDPLTITLIVAAATLAIMFFLWAIAMIGTTS